MINKIGVENFRVFKEYTEFEIRPITLLTGPNNAGKSSFTKLLLLLKNGIQKLNFHEGLHNLESFDKVLNWDKKDEDKVLKLRFENRIPILSNDFFVEYKYVKGKIGKITIADNDTILLEFSHQKSNVDNPTDFIFNYNMKINFNINYFINLIYSLHIQRELLQPLKNSLVLKTTKKCFKDFNLKENQEFLDTDFGNLMQKYSAEINHDITGENVKLIRDTALQNEINKLEKNYLLYDIIANGKNITDQYKKKLLEIQEHEFSKITFQYTNSPDLDLNNFIDVLKYSIKQINSTVKYKIRDFYKKELSCNTIEIKESALGKLIFTEKLYDNEIGDGKYFSTSLFDQITKLSQGIEYDFKKLEYISANRGSQKRVLSNKSENDIDEIVVAFFQKKGKNIDYLNQILGILEIEGELIVQRFENVISVVYLKTGDKKIALSDLGYGYSQIIPIILKLINMISYNQEINFPSEGTIIIEEPEANLHPNLQSKLADVFVSTLKFYPDLKFIIETHSEYFIRKLQYLTAKKEISTDSSVIYYFNADKYVTTQEPKVKKIEIRENGNLSDTFGPGFYDETTRLQFDLMKLNQEQNN
jgi:predicted ATPase